LRFRVQTAEIARQQPLWLRAVTLFCVLLLGSASVAQAAHIHGQWLPHSKPEVSKYTAGPLTSAEDACPLCVAMHSALPVQAVALPAATLVESTQVPAFARRFVPQIWQFEQFSRPPPVLF
jgi:hypothetical protein